jgi:hypothetical protein
MKVIRKIFKWIKKSRKWVFSGIGVTILSLLFTMLFNNKDNTIGIDDTTKEVNNVEINGNVNGNIYQNSTIYNLNEDIENVQSIEKELVIEFNGERIYPISIDIMDEQNVGDWVYFRYMVEEKSDFDTLKYPALFRYKKDEKIARCVNEGACYSFEVVGDCVYYLDSTKSFQDHGELYVSRPDGKNERLLDDELYDFQIVDEQYIYYTYRHDTYGVGLDGHALHRMRLDGSEIMIVAYEVSGTDFGISHFDFKVVDGWVDCGTFKMELGEPADGFEKIVFNDLKDNDWVYYVTNRLIKARRDGSEIVELDGVDDYWYEIERVEDDWIYYIKGGEKYKIRTDGSEKEAITSE